jgi:hypothetical protein
MKIRLIKHFDANGDEILDEDERDRVARRVVEDKGRLSVPLMMMDARARGASNRAAPAGTYYLRDQHGRVCGIGDEVAEARRVQAAADYGQRLANAHKLKCNPGLHLDHGKPDPRRWYVAWQREHGHM